MPADYAEVLKELEDQESTLESELAAIRAAKPAILLLAKKQGMENRKLFPTGRFVGVGASRAIPDLLKNIHVALTTSEIVDRLKAEGWTTEAQNPVATISATLSQLAEKGFVEKVGEGWKSRNPFRATLVNPATFSSTAQ